MACLAVIVSFHGSGNEGIQYPDVMEPSSGHAHKVSLEVFPWHQQVRVSFTNSSHDEAHPEIFPWLSVMGISQ